MNLLFDALAAGLVFIFFLWANFLSQPGRGILPVRIRIPRSVLSYLAVFALVSYLSMKYM